MGHVLNPVTMKSKSAAAEVLCKWLIATIAYCEHANLIQDQPQVSHTSPCLKPAPEPCMYLSKADIVEIKSLHKPPKPVMIVCACIGILLGKHDNSGWAGAKAMISDATFLKTLLEYKRDCDNRAD